VFAAPPRAGCNAAAPLRANRRRTHRGPCTATDRRRESASERWRSSPMNASCWRTAGTPRQRLTFGPALEFWPTWSDNKRFVYGSAGGGRRLFAPVASRWTGAVLSQEWLRTGLVSCSRYPWARLRRSTWCRTGRRHVRS